MLFHKFYLFISVRIVLYHPLEFEKRNRRGERYEDVDGEKAGDGLSSFSISSRPRDIAEIVEEEKISLAPENRRNPRNKNPYTSVH